MTLSNAERQRRFREKQKAAAGSSELHLSDEQRRDRAAVMSERIYPDETRNREAEAQKPRFMGWTCHDWAEAPSELIEHFGIRDAWSGWQAEKEAVQLQLSASYAAIDAKAAAIIKEHGKATCDLASNGMGQAGLLSAYRKDPTLSAFKPKGRRR